MSREADRTRRAVTRQGALALAGLVSGACARRGSGRIAVIPKTTSIDYWENLHAGAISAAKRLGLRVFWNGPQLETNYAQQAAMLEEVVRQRVDGIVLAPSHGSVLASAVRHARAEGVPVVVVDSPVMVDPSEYLAYIGSDPKEMGILGAERTGTVLDGRGEIAILGVSPTVEAAVARERAFAAHIAAKLPGIRIVEARYGLADHVRAREITADILRSRPGLGAIFASDQFSTRGAFIALRSLGSKTRLIGVAQERDLLYYVEGGFIDALIVQDPYSMGRSAVDILGAELRGRYTGERRIQTRIAVATRDNLRQAAIQSLVRLQA